MKAFCINTEHTICPFGDRVGDVRVVDRSLRDVQRQALNDAGVSLADTVPENEPYILFSDRTWFTAELITKMIGSEYGRLRIKHPKWLSSTGALQELGDEGLYELAHMPPGSKPEFESCFVTDITDLDVRPVELGSAINAMKHPVFKGPDDRVFWVGTEMVLQIDHWVHILRVNHLSMGYAIEKGKQEFSSMWFVSKAVKIICLLMKSRSFNKWNLTRQINTIEKGVDIHPTAVVEFSTLKKGAKIGPFAVVRGSYIGENAVVEQFALVQGSIVGNDAYLPGNAMLNLCVAYPGAMISTGGGYQMCLFGYECFIAHGATVLDLSFGKPIKVRSNDDSGTIDSKTNFLGAVIGHRAKIGNAVRIGYGVSIPNDAFVVASADSLLRDWNNAPTGEAVKVIHGKAVPASLKS